MIQQSNCFVVVERGAAHEQHDARARVGRIAAMNAAPGSNLEKGQMVAADYTMSPTVHFSEQGYRRHWWRRPGRFRARRRLAGVVAGGRQGENEASTTLLLIDNRSGVQLSAAAGQRPSNYDISGIFGGGLFGGALGGLAAAVTPRRRKARSSRQSFMPTRSTRWCKRAAQLPGATVSRAVWALAVP
jgi:hypothetical protein